MMTRRTEFSRVLAVFKTQSKAKLFSRIVFLLLEVGLVAAVVAYPLVHFLIDSFTGRFGLDPSPSPFGLLNTRPVQIHNLILDLWGSLWAFIFLWVLVEFLAAVLVRWSEWAASDRTNVSTSDDYEPGTRCVLCGSLLNEGQCFRCEKD